MDSPISQLPAVGAVTSADLVPIVQGGLTSKASVGQLTQGNSDALAALQLTDYAALRAYSGPRQSVYVTGYLATAAPSGIAGLFVRDSHDTTSADNGGSVIVSASNVRWKRQFSGNASIAWFATLDDGVGDAAIGIGAAAAAFPGKAIFMPDPTVRYLLKTAITLPVNTTLFGAAARSCQMKKGFNGDAFTLSDGAAISHATLDGDGTNFTGRGLVIGGTDSNQKCYGLRVINMDGACVDYTTTTCGSQSTFTNCEMYRVNAGTGTGRYAITMAHGTQLGAVPRKFIGLETGGTCSIDFGGCNDVFVTGSFLADLAFTPDSRGVNIVASRIANQAALTVDGHNNSIVGCDIAPQITIAANADAITIGPGSFNNLPVIDNSGNNHNSVHHWTVPYTPTLASGGTAPVLGNGSLSGEYSRQGHIRIATINFTVGSTTTLGSGPLRFGLPELSKSGMIAEVGTAVINRGGTLYTATAQIPGNVQYCELIRDTSGSVTFNSPATFAAGDTIRLTLTF